MAVKAARAARPHRARHHAPEHGAADQRARRVREGLPTTSTSRAAASRCRDDWRADVDAMAAAVDDDTVLVVGSAPQYPQGVIDPIAGDRRARRRRATSTATSTRAWAA